VPYRLLAYLPDRRSTRTEDSLHINVSGFDASRRPYQEKVSTLSINCHGCRFLSRNKVVVGDMISLEVVSRGTSASKSLGRVRSFKQLPASDTIFEVAVELDVPRDIWGIASPPEDWAGFSQPDLSKGAVRELHIVSRPELAEKRSPETKAIAVDPAASFPSLGSHANGFNAKSGLPPLLTQLVSGLREEPKVTKNDAASPAAANNGVASLEEACSKLESRATKVLESSIRAWAKELNKGNEETRQPSLSQDQEQWLRRVQQVISAAGRKSA
jgi:hypothetical protein